MARVYVGLGSNLDREKRLCEAMMLLRERFGDIEVSPVYDSVAVGFVGSNFLNLVAGFDTELGVEAVASAFHDIENQSGRDRSQPKFASRFIDLDILVYDDLIQNTPGIHVPRPEILVNAYVLKPLQDIAPHRLHPETGQSYSVHWLGMAPTAPHLAVYSLEL